MKRCPKCQRTYPDDAPAFCVNDGAQLANEDAPAFDPQKTILASAPPPPQAPPTPPQQYSNPAPPPQAAWPPPPPPSPQQGQQQQAQNWGGYYQPGQQQQPGQQPYPQHQQYAPAAAVPGGKGLSLATFLTGLISLLAVSLIFLMAQRVIDYDRDVAEICFWGSAALGLVAIVLGALALISRRQRSKWMAILGIVFGLPALLFFAYVVINYGWP